MWPEVRPVLIATGIVVAVGIGALVAARFYAPFILVEAIAAVVWFVYVCRRMTTGMASRGRPRWLRWTVVVLTLLSSAGGIVWVADMGRHPATESR